MIARLSTLWGIPPPSAGFGPRPLLSAIISSGRRWSCVVGDTVGGDSVVDCVGVGVVEGGVTFSNHLGEIPPPSSSPQARRNVGGSVVGGGRWWLEVVGRW